MAEHEDQPVDEQQAAAPKERGIWQRIKDGLWSAVTGIPKTIMWTLAFFGGSYGLGKVTKNKKWDFMGVTDAIEDDKGNYKPIGEMAKNVGGMLVTPSLIGGGLNFLGGALLSPQSGTPAAPTNLPQDVKISHKGQTY